MDTSNKGSLPVTTTINQTTSFNAESTVSILPRVHNIKIDFELLVLPILQSIKQSAEVMRSYMNAYTSTAVNVLTQVF